MEQFGIVDHGLCSIRTGKHETEQRISSKRRCDTAIKSSDQEIAKEWKRRIVFSASALSRFSDVITSPEIHPPRLRTSDDASAALHYMCQDHLVIGITKLDALREALLQSRQHALGNVILGRSRDHEIQLRTKL